MTQNFVRIAQGACQYCIASEVMHMISSFRVRARLPYVNDAKNIRN